MENYEEVAQGGGLKRKETLGGGSDLRKGTLGGGSVKEKESRGGGFNVRKETRGGGSNLRKDTQGGGLQLRFGRVLEKKDQGGSSSDEAGYVRYSRHGSAQGGVHKKKIYGQRTSNVHRQRCSASSDSGDELSFTRLERNRHSRNKEGFGGARKRKYSTTSSGSRSESPSQKRVRLRGCQEGDNKLMDKFLAILEKIKSSDKPKLTFNANVVPEFDPLSKDQTVLTWITKVEECAEIYGWEEKEIIHYSLPKLCGVAKTWFQGLTSVLHSWSEWKKKLLESFPSREDYAEILTEMLAMKVQYGESLEHYYYAKINLLNRCNITGKHAVDCLLYGIEDRTVKVGAKAAQFHEPEQVLKYFKTVNLISQDRDNQNTIQKDRFGYSTNRVNSPKPGNVINPSIRCFICNEIGHPRFKCDKASPSVKCYNCNGMGHRSFRCEKPLAKCTTCSRVGHLTSNCYNNIGRDAIENGKSSTSGNDPNAATDVRNISRRNSNR